MFGFNTASETFPRLRPTRRTNLMNPAYLSPPSSIVPQFSAERKILLVEDDQEYRQAIARSLDDFLEVPPGDTLKIVQANGPKAALQCLQQDTFELMITDNRMPNDKDGVNLMKTIREAGPQKDIPIIMLSNDVLTDALAKAVSALSAQFIPKGDLSELLSAIQQVLKWPD